MGRGMARGREGGGKAVLSISYRWGAECKFACITDKLWPQASAEHLLTL